MDIYYPLPKEKLVERFRPLTDLILNRQSGVFVGLPKSAKSGYLRFLLEEKLILAEMLGARHSKEILVYLRLSPVCEPNNREWLITLLSELYKFRGNMFSFPSHSVADLHVLLLDEIRRLHSEDIHITLLLDKYDHWKEASKAEVESIKSIYECCRTVPHQAVSLVLLTYGYNPVNTDDNDFLAALNSPFSENTLYFPVLDLEEFGYSSERVSQLYPAEGGTPDVSKLYRQYGGIYPYLLNHQKLLHNCAGHLTLENQLGNISETIWNSFNSTQKRVLINNVAGRSGSDPELERLGILSSEGELKSAELLSYLKKLIKQDFEEDNDLKIFTETESRVFKSLLQDKGKPLSRERIAELVWGAEYALKYSEWAIDKVISRIREKIVSQKLPYVIITQKGYGYAVNEI